MVSDKARTPTIVFDLFGVLVSSGLESALDGLVAELRRSPEQISEAYEAAEPEFDRGEIDQEEFWVRILAALEVTMDWRILNSIVIDSYRILPNGLALLDEVREQSNPVVLMTNTRLAWLDELDRKWSLLDKFDRLFISSEFGARKPESGLYEAVEHDLGINGESLLLIDDTSENIEVAAARGWRSLHCTSAFVAEPQLRRLAPELPLPPYLAAYSGVIVPTVDGILILQDRDTRSNISNPGMLSVFGGDARTGEAPEECARRELFEETGHMASELRFLCVLGVPVSKNRFKICTYFVSDPVRLPDLSIGEGRGLSIPAEEALESAMVTEHAREAIAVYLKTSFG